MRRWAPEVRLELAETGVARLDQMMYGGRRERIVLLPAVVAVALGS